MITVVSGIRDIDDASAPDVEMVIADALLSSDEVRFGGALGVDTMALHVAYELADVETSLHVVVPGRVVDQPKAAAKAIRDCADRVTELMLPISGPAFLRRNDHMLMGADRLVAFIDDRSTGGTAYTIRHAKELGIETDVVQVTASAKGKRGNPQMSVDSIATVFSLRRYHLAHPGRRDWATDLIRAMKVGAGAPDDIAKLAGIVAGFIAQQPELRDLKFIAPMPRRHPGIPSDLDPLARRISELTKQPVLTNWLARSRPPVGGFVHASRHRFPANEHAASMVVTEPAIAGSTVMILDNVLTTSGSMLGAQLAVQRDTGSPPPGLAVLYSATEELARRTRRD